MRAQSQESAPLVAKPKCQEDDLSKCRVVIRTGQKAPFDGVLLTTPFAAELAAKLDGCLATVDAERERADKIQAIERSACAAKLEIAADAAKAKQQAIQDVLTATQAKELACTEALGQEEAKHWFWAAGGVAAGLVTGALVGVGATMYFVLSTD